MPKRQECAADRECSLLALSGLFEQARRISAIGRKGDIIRKAQLMPFARLPIKPSVLMLYGHRRKTAAE